MTLEKKTVTVHTTLPEIDDAALASFRLRTERLLVRPLRHPADLAALHAVRSQAAAMTSSRSGRPDASLAQTEDKLKRLGPPYRDSHVYFGIFLLRRGKRGHEQGQGLQEDRSGDTDEERDGDGEEEGELIGDGGVHAFAGSDSGWPELGYKFKREHWGRGYATEFAAAFVRFWWGLPRRPGRVEVAECSISGATSSLSSPMYGGGEGGERGGRGIVEPGEVAGDDDHGRTATAAVTKGGQGQNVNDREVLTVSERLCAWTTASNEASQKVLCKVGFERFDGLENGLVNWRATRMAPR
ncbi:hypothetical protein LQW54_012484 [Pestalotiopsis sp. IQ-011]